VEASVRRDGAARKAHARRGQEHLAPAHPGGHYTVPPAKTPNDGTSCQRRIFMTLSRLLFDE
jgi:hypothetical protein